jgi:hypothetical protein
MFDRDQFDVYLQLASHHRVSTWAAQFKSIASPSIRSAGHLDLTDLVDARDRHQRLLVAGLLSALGTMTNRAYNQIVQHKGRPKPLLQIGALHPFNEALKGNLPLKVNSNVKGKIDELLSRFDVTFHSGIDDMSHLSLNAFAKGSLFGKQGVSLLDDPDSQYRPQAIAIAAFGNTRNLPPLTPTYWQQPLS